MPLVTGGRYGLGSKEFTPGMVAGVFAELAHPAPRQRFTVGINDDVSGSSLPYDDLDIEDPATTRAVFFGLGSDGTVSANKNSIKILGDAGLHAQGYFVYDSKKSGSETVSHLRFGPRPVSAPYLIGQAGFVGVHQARLIGRAEVLNRAAPGAVVLLNTPVPADAVWDSLPESARSQVQAKKLTLYAIDAAAVARAAGLGGRVNTVLQTCFFALLGGYGGRPPGLAESACCRWMRRSRRSSRRSRRATGGAGRRSWRGTTRRWTRRWPGCTRCPCRQQTCRQRRAARRGAARRIVTSAGPRFSRCSAVRADGHGGDAGGPR